VSGTPLRDAPTDDRDSRRLSTNYDLLAGGDANVSLRTTIITGSRKAA
jgi:hypothetical protein